MLLYRILDNNELCGWKFTSVVFLHTLINYFRYYIYRNQTQFMFLLGCVWLELGILFSSRYNEDNLLRRKIDIQECAAILFLVS